MSIRDEFLKEVLAFLDAASISPSLFGRKAVGDPSFITRLKRGADVTASTMDKARSYMTANQHLTLL